MNHKKQHNIHLTYCFYLSYMNIHFIKIHPFYPSLSRLISNTFAIDQTVWDLIKIMPHFPLKSQRDYSISFVIIAYLMSVNSLLMNLVWQTMWINSCINLLEILSWILFKSLKWCGSFQTYRRLVLLDFVNGLLIKKN